MVHTNILNINIFIQLDMSVYKVMHRQIDKIHLQSKGT